MSNTSNQSGPTRQSTPSLGEFVYQELLRSIREGIYHPGDRLREAQISSTLGVSRTPVREAMRRLQSEGRLISEPQRGVTVAELDPQEVTELYAVRQHFEGVAARFAAQHATDAEIETMEYILSRSLDAGSDRRRMNQTNWDLHYAIYHAAHNRFLIRSITALADSMALLRGAKYIPKDRPEALHREHQAIVMAIKARDPEEADRLAQSHIQNAFRIHLKAAFEAKSNYE